MSSKMNSNNNRQSAQNQNGKPNLQLMSASEKLALLDDSDDEKDCFHPCGPRSPLNWICDLSGGNNNPEKRNNGKKKSLTTGNRSLQNNSDRKKLSQDFFNSDESDEEDESNTNNNNNHSNHNNNNNKNGNHHHHHATSHFHSNSNMTTVPESIIHELNSSINLNGNNHPHGHNNLTNSIMTTDLSAGPLQQPEHTGPRPIQGEARIVAPHVSKLSPYSAVEVRLQSNSECVAVLCSVDVLKMRSGFFHDILNEQEKGLATKQATGNGVPISHPLQSNLLWRDPIIIPELMPFEAAAFLESLHEGRALFKGEWNYCWARLSVTWVVEELIQEYACQIEDHMNKIASSVQNNHWRTNPSVLAGMRIAVFRKSTGPIPTVITGTILESPPNIGYSKVRVVFDNERVPNSRYYQPPGTVPYNNSFSPIGNDSSSSSFRGGFHHDFSDGNGGLNISGRGAYSMNNMYNSKSSPTSTISTNAEQLHLQTQIQQAQQSGSSTQQSQQQQQQPVPPPQPIVGDVTEPIWIQNNKEGSSWYEPDELFLLESKRYLTNTDKRIFWEMAKALIELPEISIACKTGIKNATELCNALKRPEYKVLWTKDAPDLLPKEIAAELLKATFLPNSNSSNNSLTSTNSHHGNLFLSSNNAPFEK